MSLIMYTQFSDHAIVLMDTLVSRPDGTSDGLEPKLWHFPHVNAVIAATGNREVVAAWCDWFTVAGITDVEALHAEAPAELRRIDAELTAAHGDIGSTTIRVFAFPAGSDRLVRCEYTSRDGYQGTIHTRDEFHVRPGLRAAEAYVAETPAEQIDLAQRIQTEQDQRPPGERVAIGGDLLCAIIQPAGVELRHVYRFDNYDDTLREIIRSRGQHSASTSPHG